MSGSSTFEVTEQDGQRLDVFVAGLREGFTRTRAQTLIRNGKILVNGSTSRPSTRLHKGDRIQLSATDAPPADTTPEPLPLSIVHEDDHVVVVDKPAGLTVHPAPGHPGGTLANALLARYPELRGVGDRLRPGIVHRLDADTSGLIMVARTTAAYQSLQKQLKDRTITKVYLALVKGQPRPSKGRIEAPIARDPRSRQRMAIVDGGRMSTTEYQTLQTLGEFTLLEVKPHTGRTHQVRVHLSAIGHPVAGDTKYGGRVPFLKRQFLHAHRLGFLLPPTGRYVEFTSPLPPDLETALATLASDPSSDGPSRSAPPG